MKQLAEPIEYGQNFRMLTALFRNGKDGNGCYTRLCVCECGSMRVVSETHLRSGKLKSCGCAGIGHGMCGTKEYNCYRDMKRRCLTKGYAKYKNHGGRGVKICKRWLDSFENFYADMGPCPHKMTINRIDNDGDYTPKNCKWSTYSEQNQNTRFNVYYEKDGLRLCLSEWARRLGVNRATLQYQWRKFRNGKVTEYKMREAKKFTHNGMTMNLREWSNELGISYQTLRTRLQVWGETERLFLPKLSTNGKIIQS